MLVQPVVEGEGSGQPSEPQPPSSTTPPEQVLAAVSQPQKTHTPRRTKKDEDRTVLLNDRLCSLENSDSLPPTRSVEGVETPYPPTTIEERLARKNKLKARDLETLSMDDLYNNLKIYEAKVMGSSSTTQNTQNVSFVSSNNIDNTNKAVNTAYGVSAASSKTNASNIPNVDSLSDAVIYSFFASQSNNPQLENEDLQQINLDDLKEIDLKWQMAMLTMRAKRFLHKTRRNLGVKGTETIVVDKTKVECYNCHKRGHFARKCKASKHQDNWDREAPKRIVLVKDTTSNALVS
nr:hypothetical protein [Tanacetum cinerariifolium]